jgi:hypothetical protein
MKVDKEFSDRIRAKAMVILDSLSDCEEFEIIAIAKEIKAQAELSMERVRAVAIRQADEAVQRFHGIFPQSVVFESEMPMTGIAVTTNPERQNKQSSEPKCQEKWINEVLQDGDEE